MGTLVIHDLPESVDLDRQAMAAITGGSMVQTHQTMLAPQPFTGLRLSAGFGVLHRTPIAEAIEQLPVNTLLR